MIDALLDGITLGAIVFAALCVGMMLGAIAEHLATERAERRARQ